MMGKGKEWEVYLIQITLIPKYKIWTAVKFSKKK